MMSGRVQVLTTISKPLKLSHVHVLIRRNGNFEIRSHGIKLPDVELHGSHNDEDPQTENADDKWAINQFPCTADYQTFILHAVDGWFAQVAELRARRLFEIARRRSISTVGCSSSASSTMELSVCGSGAKPLSSWRKRT
eukprot:jgi/Tetstr1/435021/TSEL_023992.t1